MPIDDEDMILNTRDYFVSENQLNPHATSEEIAAFLRRARTTGKVEFTWLMNQGGIQRVLVVERTACSDDEANEIRRILGMDYEEVELPIAVNGNRHRRPLR